MGGLGGESGTFGQPSCVFFSNIYLTLQYYWNPLLNHAAPVPALTRCRGPTIAVKQCVRLCVRECMSVPLCTVPWLWRGCVLSCRVCALCDMTRGAA